MSCTVELLYKYIKQKYTFVLNGILHTNIITQMLRIIDKHCKRIKIDNSKQISLVIFIVNITIWHNSVQYPRCNIWSLNYLNYICHYSKSRYIEICNWFTNCISEDFAIAAAIAMGSHSVSIHKGYMLLLVECSHTCPCHILISLQYAV